MRMVSEEMKMYHARNPCNIPWEAGNIPWDTGNIPWDAGNIPWDASGHHKCGQVVVYLTDVSFCVATNILILGSG